MQLAMQPPAPLQDITHAVAAAQSLVWQLVNWVAQFWLLHAMQVGLPAKNAAAQSHSLAAVPVVAEVVPDEDVDVVPLEVPLLLDVLLGRLTGLPTLLGSSLGRGGNCVLSLQPNSVTTVGPVATPRTTRIRPTSRMGE